MTPQDMQAALQVITSTLEEIVLDGNLEHYMASIHDDLSLDPVRTLKGAYSNLLEIDLALEHAITDGRVA